MTIEPVASVAQLIEQLRRLGRIDDWESFTRANQIVDRLGELGAQAQPAVPLLIGLMHSDPRGLGTSIGVVLGEIAGDEAIRELNKCWLEPDRKLRNACRDGLSLAGERAHETLLRIVHDLNESADERACALKSLEGSGYPLEALQRLRAELAEMQRHRVLPNL
jgi:hypothetical protein